uniref:Uncharacterized protein n=1 Tax=Setaria italica TaxID=4555 RepID=K3YNL4_SETIT
MHELPVIWSCANYRRVSLYPTKLHAQYLSKSTQKNLKLSHCKYSCTFQEFYIIQQP